MRQFDIIVCSHMVAVEEVFKPLTRVDVRANVDGEKFVYRIKKLRFNIGVSGWRERGYIQAYYHAKNAGTCVEFIEVNLSEQPRTDKKHTQALRLFD